MNAPLNPALLAPTAKCYAVTIVFDSGHVHQMNVDAESWSRARELALRDAVAMDGGFCQGKPLSISADRPP